jgi:MFS family permease
MITGLMLIIPTSLMYFVVREGDYAGPSAEPAGRPRERPAPVPGGRLGLLAIPGFAAALGVLFVARFADRALPPILPLLLSELDTPRAQLATITGLVVSIGAVSAACSATFYGRRSRPENNRRLLMIALAGGALGSLLLALASSWQQVLVVRLVLGLLAGGSLSLAYTLGARLAPAERSGLALGTLASCAQLGSASSPLLAGMLGGIGLHFVFLTNAAAYLMAIVLVAFGARAAHRAGDPELASEPEAG